MPSINLGRVKGDPLRYEDLTEAQKLELKGEKGDTPIVKAGTTTTLEFDQEAKVTSETNGDVTSFNFQIPMGQKPPFYGAYSEFPETGDPNRTYIDNTVDPRIMYTWDPATQTYILTGGAGGADGSSIDIPVTLPSTGWTGTSAPYQQTLTVPQIREGMTPLFYLSSTGSDAEYAYSLITGYTTAYASITFYAADLPTVDLSLTLKGIPAQEMEYVDNTIVVIVEPSSFALSTDPDYDGRYVATIPVEGIQAGAGGGWDIVRSGPVLSEAESKIALSITDVKCLDGSVEIVALEVPAQRFLMSLQGTYAGAGDGDIILSGMTEWFAKVDSLEVMKREQMAPYGYFGIEWDLDELMALVRAGSWDKFAIGDYFIETTTAGEQIMWEVAGKNNYLHCGDTELTANHIVCCPRDCLETYYKYNETNTNEGGYAGSLMPANLETEANKFSSKLQGYMTTIRRLENNKGIWAWVSRRIFLPGNPELVGFHGFADMWDGGAFNQLPLFVGGNAHLLKGAGFNKSKAARMWYWTADPSAADTTYFCYFGNNGYSSSYDASDDGGVAPLIVLS